VPLLHHALLYGDPFRPGYASLTNQRFAADAARGLFGFDARASFASSSSPWAKVVVSSFSLLSSSPPFPAGARPQGRGAPRRRPDLRRHRLGRAPARQLPGLLALRLGRGLPLRAAVRRLFRAAAGGQLAAPPRLDGLGHARRLCRHAARYLGHRDPAHARRASFRERPAMALVSLCRRQPRFLATADSGSRGIGTGNPSLPYSFNLGQLAAWPGSHRSSPCSRCSRSWPWRCGARRRRQARASRDRQKRPC